MSNVVFSKENLAKLIDDCISDLDSKGGSRLQSLGNLFEILGATLENDFLTALAIPIGTLGMNVAWFHTSPAISMLVPETRQRYEKLLQETVTNAKKLLVNLKQELCNDSHPNATKVIEIIAGLDRLWLKLSEEQGKLKSIQPQLQME